MDDPSSLTPPQDASLEAAGVKLEVTSLANFLIYLFSYVF